MAVFVGNPRLSGSLAVKGCLVCLLTFSAFGLWAQQIDPDRPHLSREIRPSPHDDSPVDPPVTVSTEAPPPPGTPIGDGLVLPYVGHVWARDIFDGRPQLVQLKYVPTDLDRHAVSNFVKTELAPFIYKPKHSIEIADAAANVRLHDSNVSIYIRWAGMGSEDAASAHETSAHTDLTLVKVEPTKDRRIIGTIASTQITGTASRSSQTISLTTEKVGNTGWRKIKPNQPLSPGEYALMRMPQDQCQSPLEVFDFAIDPNAPANANAITPITVTPSQ